MTKADLEDLINLKKELAMWEEYQKHLKRKTYQNARTDREAVSLAETEKTISDLTERINGKISGCVKFISGIEKSDIRQALFYRYVDGKNYIQTAMKLGTTEEAIRTKVRRYLKKRGIR